MSYIVKSKYIDRFICFSKEECEYYPNLFCVNKKRFVYVPVGVNADETVEVKDECFLFATGRSNRNYDFIIKALENTSYKVIIACDNYTKSQCPPNINILNDCYGDDMRNLMAKCHCVLIPLSDLSISSGQLVVLQAMSMGKPVICTNADGIRDYVYDGETGYLVENTKEAWLYALKTLDSQDVWQEISMKAKFIYKQQFTETAMFERIAKLIAENK